MNPLNRTVKSEIVTGAWSRRRTRLLTVVAVSSALALAGCGGSDDSSNESKGGNVVVNVDANDQSSVVVPEGRFFSDNSPWNRRIDGTNNVDPDSDRMIRFAQERVGVTEVPGSDVITQRRDLVDSGLYINTYRWTVPVVAGGRPTKLVCRQLVCGDGSSTTTLNVPDDVDPDPRYDGWYTVFDTSASVAYDFWRARREGDDTISYNFMRRWDLNGPGYSPPYTEAARGSGLPLFAGLIRPGELQSGEIRHALAISIPGPATGYFVQPASSTDGNGRPASLPEGARIRLKRNVVLPQPRDPITGKLIRLTAQQRRMADAVTACLRTYGAIVVDRAAVPTLYAQRNVSGTLLKGNELQGLTLNDFEVMEIGKAYRYPPESQDILLVNPTASPSAGATASPSSSPTSSLTVEGSQ